MREYYSTVNSGLHILQVHCRYSSGTGGEDVVVENERAALTSFGCKVRQFFASNAGVASAPVGDKVRAGIELIWSRSSATALTKVIEDYRPDVVHVHNTFARLSGSVFWAARKHAPVILTAHNYRAFCATSTLRGDQALCERCLHVPFFPAIVHGCRYGESRTAAVALSAHSALHRLLGTYRQAIDRWIVFTSFQRDKVRLGGVDDARISVIPNFVLKHSEPLLAASERNREVLFVGQLTRDKGIHLLLDGWRELCPSGWRLLIVGDGPEMSCVATLAAESTNVSVLGKMQHKQILGLMARARFVVIPSLWYEGCPLVLLEAFSTGTPVIVPNLGAFPDLLKPDEGGAFFEFGNTRSLVDALRRACAMNDEAWSSLAAKALQNYQQRYCPEVVVPTLLRTYRQAIKEYAARTGTTPS